MAEPVPALVRPTRMKISVVLSCAALALLTGCGSSGGAGSAAGSSADAPSAQPSAQTIGACATDAPGVTGASVLTQADLDGDGRPEQVRLTSPDGSCPNVLFAEIGGRYVSVQVPTDGPPVTKAQAVAVPGVTEQLVSTRQEHPRGGFQVRVYDLAGGRLQEVTDGGRPIVPFIATDVQEHPLSLSCTRGALVKTEAVAHEPVGVAPAFDIRRTTYAVAAQGVTAAAPQEIADNVLPAQLEAKYPELAGHTMFSGCR